MQATRRVVLVCAVIVAGSSALATWWATTLWGLPDIGDPFDVAAFADPGVPDAENAFVLYRQAAAKLVAEPDQINPDWSTAGPIEKGWLESNREPLEVWRRGTERSKALYLPPRSMNVMTPLPVVQDLRSFARLARLEAGRLQAEGDLEAAWRWHRAVSRSSRHLGWRGTPVERLVGGALFQSVNSHISAWAIDPRVTPTMLRRAIDAAIEDFALSPPISDLVKVEYIGFMNTFSDSELVWKCVGDSEMNLTGRTDWLGRHAGVFSLAKVARQEPERSRRILRLVFANVLTGCDLPPERRPPVAGSLPDLSNPARSTPIVDLYAVDAASPPGARALPYDAILDWYRSSLYASRFSPSLKMVIGAVDAQRTSQANLLIALANQLFERECGKPPDSVEELVGPYLRALPEGYRLNP